MATKTVEKKVCAFTQEIEACRKELFTLKMNVLVGPVKDTSQFKKLRRKIARAKTALSAQSVTVE